MSVSRSLCLPRSLIRRRERCQWRHLRRRSYWKNGMALLPPSSQELPLLPPPLLSGSKGFFISSRLFFSDFLYFIFLKKILRSGGRFTHVWRRLLQAFVPEASFFFSLFCDKQKSNSTCVLLILVNKKKKKLQGFPSSVTPDYVPFQVWDLLQVKENQHKFQHANVFEVRKYWKFFANYISMD